MWESGCFTTLQASTACYRDSFTIFTFESSCSSSGSFIPNSVLKWTNKTVSQQYVTFRQSLLLCFFLLIFLVSVFLDISISINLLSLNYLIVLGRSIQVLGYEFTQIPPLSDVTISYRPPSLTSVRTKHIFLSKLSGPIFHWYLIFKIIIAMCD
jgi:hypothetical protein